MTSKFHKNLAIYLVTTLFFLFIFSFSVNAVSVSELQTGTLSESFGTAGIVFNSEGTKLFATDSNHGNKPNFISEYILTTAYDLSTISFLNSTNLTSIIPSVLSATGCCINNNYTSDWGLTASYITRNGLNLYVVYSSSAINDMDTQAYHVRSYAIIHFNMNSFDTTTLNFTDTYQMYNTAGSSNPFSTGTQYTSPNIRGIYVTDDGKYLILSGSSGDSPSMWAFNMSSPYYLTSMVNYTIGGGYILPFQSPQETGLYLSYYNLWVSPDLKTRLYNMKRTHSTSSNTIYIATDGVNGGNGSGILTSQREGQTITSSFGSFYLFNQQAGTIYKYQINNISFYENQAKNISEGQKVIVGQIIDPLIALFPASETLNLGQKIGFVVFFMFLTAVIILFAGSTAQDGIKTILLWLIVGLWLIEFVYFVAISYIPISILITLVLLATAIILIRIKGGN